jgi:TolB protein
VLDVETGTITPLPGDLGDGRHFRWSGDGSRLVYATESCGLEVASTEGAEGIAVPAVGDPLPFDNPDGLAACQAGSVDATGRRVAVPLSNPGESTGPETADAVVDTTTGDLVTLPVTGRVLGAVFDAEGNLLVRALRLGTTTLSLIAPDNTLLVQAVEPAAVNGLELLAYTG